MANTKVNGTMTFEETENRSDSTAGDQATDWATKKLNPDMASYPRQMNTSKFYHLIHSESLKS
jgi:hypothetical protein